MAKQYFVKRKEDVSGPFSGGRVKSEVAAGTILVTDEISPRPTGPWRAISDIPQLRGQGALATVSDAKVPAWARIVQIVRSRRDRPRSPELAEFYRSEKQDKQIEQLVAVCASLIFGGVTAWLGSPVWACVVAVGAYVTCVATGEAALYLFLPVFAVLGLSAWGYGIYFLLSLGHESPEEQRIRIAEQYRSQIHQSSSADPAPGAIETPENPHADNNVVRGDGDSPVNIADGYTGYRRMFRQIFVQRFPEKLTSNNEVSIKSLKDEIMYPHTWNPLGSLSTVSVHVEGVVSIRSVDHAYSAMVDWRPDGRIGDMRVAGFWRIQLLQLE